MQENLPIIYLSVLLLLLGGTAIFLLQQVVRTRRVESKFSRLQKKITK
jgi:hypothetical protein